ncbi:MAG: single-stranded-DNA-specific exonuclease RecJ [Myxococcales bacterium]|nr:single-stranded-DNA-specific exonuclease RecJ [Myxococcales bacterium]USN50614.1 MAG: single-stranded-DNA-specific exonuclease RecJ [Myxococcales bacterium]
MKSKKIWKLRQLNSQIEQTFISELGLSHVLSEILARRPLHSLEELKDFLQPSLKNLKEPYQFVDMEKAAGRIVKAITTGEHIGLFGDYDVDGVCSTALLSQFLDMCGAQFSSTLPNRMNEGYGLSVAGVDRLHQQGAQLIITADCGITAHAQIDYARSLGIEVIVVDHHEVGDSLPNAYAVVNPKRQDCESDASYLCAAGVCFFLVLAIRRILREQNFFSMEAQPDVKKLLDLVALATVSDVVPLIKDNRILIKAGLAILKKGQRIGLNALLEASKINRQKISSTNLGFHLGPRINAAGRLEDATQALFLLNQKDSQKALTTAYELDVINQERKEIERATVEEAIAIVESWPDYQQLPALVLHQEHWHPGVVGIVASRVAEYFHRPSIIIGEKGKGSGRSIPGIDLHDMVLKSSQSLSGFGGHAHAIGLTLGTQGAEQFRKDLLRTFSKSVDQEIFIKKISYDAELDLSQISLALVDELSLLEPCGAKNPHPVIRINGCFMRNLRRLNGGHLKGEIENSKGRASFIAFRTDISDELVSTPLDILAVIEKNEWLGNVSAQLRLLDYKRSEGMISSSPYT